MSKPEVTKGEMLRGLYLWHDLYEVELRMSEGWTQKKENKTRRLYWAICSLIESHGQEPGKGKLDPKDPPRGDGSGVPGKP
jgi:hypothetical protein